jgi:hypothetical protein
VELQGDAARPCALVAHHSSNSTFDDFLPVFFLQEIVKSAIAEAMTA